MESTESPGYVPGPGAIKRRPRAQDFVRSLSTGIIYQVTAYHGGRNPWVTATDGGSVPLYLPVTAVETLSRAYVKQAL